MDQTDLGKALKAEETHHLQINRYYNKKLFMVMLLTTFGNTLGRSVKTNGGRRKLQ